MIGEVTVTEETRRRVDRTSREVVTLRLSGKDVGRLLQEAREEFKIRRPGPREKLTVRVSFDLSNIVERGEVSHKSGDNIDLTTIEFDESKRLVVEAIYEENWGAGRFCASL